MTMSLTTNQLSDLAWVPRIRRSQVAAAFGGLGPLTAADPAGPPHLQSAWLLLLFCGAPRCTYMLRTLPTADTAAFATRHDAAVLSCLEMLAKPGRRSHTRVLCARSSPCTWGAWAGVCGPGTPRCILGVMGGHAAGARRSPSGHARGPSPPTALAVAFLDDLGDHRPACAQVGTLARQVGLLERAAARICKEAGARVATNVALRDLNLDVPAADGRRIEIVANGLPLWQGAQLAIDATIVSPVKRDGSARPGADSEPGLALAQVLDRKHRTYSELQRAGRCKLAVFGVELGARSSRSTLTFFRLLGRASARQRAPWCVAGAQQALVRRWTKKMKKTFKRNT